MTPTIRVLLGEMPQTLREILQRALRHQGDIVLVNEAEGVRPDEVEAAPDILIVGSPAAQDRDPASAILDRWPRARVLMVTESGRRTVLYQLRPHQLELGELSPHDLVAAIRTAARRPAFTGKP